MRRTFLVWLAKLLRMPLVLRPPEVIIEAAAHYGKQIKDRSEPWEWKQQSVLRALRNEFPSVSLRTLNLAIEIMVHECLG